MKKTNEETGNIEKALTVFGQIIVDDRKEQNLDRKELRGDIKTLTVSVNKLILSDVEARKEREFESEQRERMEGNQKEQGQEIKHNSDTILKHSGKIEVLEKKQDFKDKVRIGIYITLGAGTIMFLATTIIPLIGKST